MVVSSYVSPKKVLWDYRVTDWDNKRWFAEEIIKPTEEVKRSNLYSNTRNLKGNLSSIQDITGVKRKLVKEYEGDLVLLVEKHDLENRKIITVAEGHNKILRKDDDYGMEVYTPLAFAPTRPKRFWGKSLAQSIEEHVIRLSNIHYYMDSHSKRGGLTKVLVDSQMFSAAALKKLRSNKDFEIIPVDGLAQGNTPAMGLKFDQVGMDWYANLNIIKKTIRELSGVTEQERGTHEAGVETAYEVARLFESSEGRNRFRMLMLNEFTSSVMEKVLRIASSYFNPAKICDMVGLPTEWSFMLLPYDKMRLSVKFGSTALEARKEQLNRVMLFFQIASQLGMQLNPQAVLAMVSKALGLELQESLLLTGGAGGAGAGMQERPPAAAPLRTAQGMPGQNQMAQIGGLGL